MNLEAFNYFCKQQKLKIKKESKKVYDPDKKISFPVVVHKAGVWLLDSGGNLYKNSFLVGEEPSYEGEFYGSDPNSWPDLKEEFK